MKKYAILFIILISTATVSSNIYGSYNYSTHALKTKAQQLKLPMTLKNSSGNTSLLQYIMPSNHPIYYKTMNLGSAKTISATAVHAGGSEGLTLDGSTIQLAIWDGGRLRDTHQVFVEGANPSRISFGDPIENNNNDFNSANVQHANHVGGTIASNGVANNNAKGLAPNVNLTSFDFSDDINEIQGLASSPNPALASNHSYGIESGWNSDGDIWFGDLSISTEKDFKFGLYSIQTRLIDQIARNNPTYTMVFAAGNEQNGQSRTTTHEHIDPTTGEFVTAIDFHPQNGPFETIGIYGTAKNIITVGAIEELPTGYTSTNTVILAPFSSMGPVDDGRIKPDIVAKGVDVFSSIPTTTTSYLTISGTSMAAPAITGAIGLIAHHQENLHTGVPLRSATIKGLLIHTADEAGNDIGPDYIFGWGVANIKNAINVMTADNTAGNNSKLIVEQSLKNNTPVTMTREITADQPFKATLCWTDPEGSIKTTLDDPTPDLVNDLDIRITHNDSNLTYFPFTLNKNSPGSPANTGDNSIDNVEQILIPDPKEGTHTITISHKGQLNTSQQYSLILSSISTVIPRESTQSLSTIRNAPNPFNPTETTTSIRYILTKPATDIKLIIIDLSGEKIWEATFSPADLTLGSHFKIWDGRNTFNEIVANGMYIGYILINTNGQQIKQRIKIGVYR